MSVLILYLGITVAGYFIGMFLGKRNIVLRGIGPFQTVTITLMVFVMGCEIGADREIVASLDTIGLTAFILTIFVLAGSVTAVFLARTALGFDRKGNVVKKAVERMEAPEQQASEEAPDVVSTEPVEKEKIDHTMTICIIVSVALGILAGYLILPEWFADFSGNLIVAGLCILLLLVGLDIGVEGTIAENFKQAGWRIIVFPFAIIFGTCAGLLVASLFLPISVKDALCTGSGFGWYTLAPAMLAEYSTRVSAMSFMHNVMREVIGIILIPIVAKKIGYIEAISLPGSSSMDVCLPIVERATKSDIAVYSFISGVVLSAAVPVMVSLFMAL